MLFPYMYYRDWLGGGLYGWWDLIPDSPIFLILVSALLGAMFVVSLFLAFAMARHVKKREKVKAKGESGTVQEAGEGEKPEMIVPKFCGQCGAMLDGRFCFRCGSESMPYVAPVAPVPAKKKGFAPAFRDNILLYGTLIIYAGGTVLSLLFGII